MTTAHRHSVASALRHEGWTLVVGLINVGFTEVVPKDGHDLASLYTEESFSRCCLFVVDGCGWVFSWDGGGAGGGGGG